ncbi:MAG: tRNA 2-selenouridine(34) synthase MnmH [Tunicatimonas sp.]
MKLTTNVFLERARHWPVLDVRSPGEYTAGHLPGAHCFPLFDDRERAQVGTTYKQIGSHEALLVGLELVGPKMRTLVEQARHLAPAREVLVHCWRGGMRSESVAWLLTAAGFAAHTLEGGYKAYRNHALESFGKIPQLIVLGGATGSGKTAVLRALQARGEQVIDLEALAHHRGSAFGGIGQGEQPTTEQFQNDLHHVWQQFDPAKRVWIEDESFSIGQVKLPLELWNVMKARPLVLLEVPRAARVQRLVQEYGSLDLLELERAVVAIQKRLGGLRTQQTLEALTGGQLAEAAGHLLSYYDKSYDRCLKKSQHGPLIRVSTPAGDADRNAGLILETVDDFSTIETKGTSPIYE